MGKRELVAVLSLSSWCLVIVVWLFLAAPWVCLQFVIVVFPDHTHLLFPVGNNAHEDTEDTQYTWQKTVWFKPKDLLLIFHIKSVVETVYK